MISVAVPSVNSVSVWTAKQFENDNADGEDFIRFRDENVVFKFIQLSVDVA